MKGSGNLKQYSIIFVMLIIFSVLISLFLSIDSFGINTMKNQEKKVQEIIRKAAVSCYALEGQYPPDLDYLVENYGVILDHKSYAYWFEPCGSNVMPSIVVKSLLVDTEAETDGEEPADYEQ